MAEDRNLPGWPKKKLVKEVRSHLWHYGIRPSKFTIWQATWTWAHAIARSYWHVHWPLPTEIASQYLLLLLADMKSSCMLRLPYRAAEQLPPEVAAMLPMAQTPGLLAIADESCRKRTRTKAAPSTIATKETPTQSKDNP
jgi:hypothetical protein